MIDAGILPGDMLLIEPGANPRDDDIVIAQVDRELGKDEAQCLTARFLILPV